MTYGCRPMPNNLVLYDGPSAIDGAPIVAILTGLAKSTKNKATGNMLQIYIIRSDVAPEFARHAGMDSSICGACSMRGRVVSLDDAREIVATLPVGKRAQMRRRIQTAESKSQATLNVERACYVIVSQAPTIIYKAFKRGVYRHAEPEQAAQYVAGNALRIGAYGDSAALPRGVIEPLAAVASTLTNYTHSGCYDKSRAGELSAFTMLSADDLGQARRYWKQGARTFRVSSQYNTVDGIKRVQDIQRNESQCPKTIDKAVTCLDCGACDGLRRGIVKSIVAPSHGNGATYHAAFPSP
jgi:hypothetical protein